MLTPNRTPALEAKQLCIRYGAQSAVDRLDVSVFPGQIYCLLGANGAGKTTTINAFLGFVTPASGSVRILGHSGANGRKLMAYVPEQLSLYPELTGYENLAYLCELARDPKDRDTLLSALRECGLSDAFVHARASQYSKGMRQKVGLAFALARKAPVLLLDEPTSGLDPQAANEFSRLLLRAAHNGAAVLMTTHDLFHVKATGTHVGIMRGGVLQSEGEVAALTQEQLEQLYLRSVQNEAA
jgi:ABC-2 type transport system ATP-binding protein